MGLQQKRVIALDIDGTLTHGKDLLPQTITFLNELLARGEEIAFVTGRTSSFALRILAPLQGKFILIAQNGAMTLSLPTKKVIDKAMLPSTWAVRLDPTFAGRGFGLLIESGIENDDTCYYKESDFSEEERKYLDFRQSICPEQWAIVDSFENLPIREFACGKFFAKEEECRELEKKYRGVSTTVIRDPFRQGYSLMQIVSLQASKSQALKKIVQGRPLIAAGDDMNDLEMLEMADFAIAMESAPQAVREKGDRIASSAEKEGLLPALKEAMEKV